MVRRAMPAGIAVFLDRRVPPGILAGFFI